MLPTQPFEYIKHPGKNAQILGEVHAEILRVPPKMKRAAGQGRLLHRLLDAPEPQAVELERTADGKGAESGSTAR